MEALAQTPEDRARVPFKHRLNTVNTRLVGPVDLLENLSVSVDHAEKTRVQLWVNDRLCEDRWVLSQEPLGFAPVYLLNPHAEFVLAVSGNGKCFLTGTAVMLPDAEREELLGQLRRVLFFSVS